MSRDLYLLFLPLDLMIRRGTEKIPKNKKALVYISAERSPDRVQQLHVLLETLIARATTYLDMEPLDGIVSAGYVGRLLHGLW